MEKCYQELVLFIFTLFCVNLFRTSQNNHISEKGKFANPQISASNRLIN